MFHYRTALRILSSGPARSPRYSTIALKLNYVRGQREYPSAASHAFPLVEPATGQEWGQVSASGAADVDAAVSAASEALPAWSALSGYERGKCLKKAAQMIREKCEAIARAEVEDNGKPIYEARSDVLGCAETLEYYGGIAATIKGEHVELAGGNFMYTRREPLGVVGAIGAWNYPFQMACWKSAPALACGNTVVFKPAQWTPRTAVMLAELYSDAGLPVGAFNVVQGEAETGVLLCEHPDVAKVSFTGSTAVGAAVMESCGRAVKHATLELGGKSPIIVFAGADLEEAVAGAMLGNWSSQGAVCSNGTRVFVHGSLLQSFVECFVRRTSQLTVGNPMSEDTRVGATIRGKHAERVLAYVQSAREEGARVACGGERVTLPDKRLAGGWYLSPCVLTDCSDGMRAVKEEIFGAVACVLPFDSEEEVIRRANDTDYGLAAGVFTNDLRQAHRVVAQLQSGTCYINSYNVNPVEMPFGGYKKSGIGRECGEACLHYYSQLKSVHVGMSKLTAPF